MSEQRTQATTGGSDDPERTQAFNVGDGLTVDLQKPDDGPWRTAPLDASPVARTSAEAPAAGSSAPAAAAETTREEPVRETRTESRTESLADAARDRGTSTEVPAAASPASESASPRPVPAGGEQPRATPTRSTLPRTNGGPERVKRATSAAAAPASGTRARRARLRLARIDPWSVLLLSLLVSLFLAVAVVVAVVALYAVLEAAGVPDSVNALVAEVTRTPGEAEPEPLLSAGRALRAAGVIAVVDVILLTALATLSAVLYNLCASFTGGLEVTLAEDA